MGDKNNLEKKSFLREFWDYQGILVDNIFEIFNTITYARPMITRYGRKKIEEFKEKGIDLHEYQKENSVDGIVSI